MKIIFPVGLIVIVLLGIGTLTNIRMEQRHELEMAEVENTSQAAPILTVHSVSGDTLRLSVDQAPFILYKFILGDTSAQLYVRIQ